MEHGIEVISLRSIAMVSGEFDHRPSRDEHTPEEISESEYRSNCNNIPGSFYVNYSNVTAKMEENGGLPAWYLEACVPTNVAESP